jgi:hypothetical protein
MRLFHYDAQAVAAEVLKVPLVERGARHVRRQGARRKPPGEELLVLPVAEPELIRHWTWMLPISPR